MSFNPRSKAAKVAIMTEHEQQALQERFARELEEWMAKRPELEAEAARNGQHLDFKVIKKFIRLGDQEVIYDQKITYTFKLLSKRAQKAKALLAALEEQGLRAHTPPLPDHKDKPER